jgi:hypothetical protein
MHHEPDDTIARALGRLPREFTPPALLEEATVRRLRLAGLLRSRRIRPAWAAGGFSVATWALAAGIAAVAFVGGSLYAARRAVPPVQATYALLLYGGGSGDDSATHVRRAAEYAEWANASHVAARVIGGEALGAPVAAVARHASNPGSDSIIVDGEPVDSSGFVGYFLVTAASREAAVRLARECPHLRYGGRVVVRRVWGD